MTYFTQFVNEPKPDAETVRDKSMIELQGYRTAKQQIESFLLAGERLKSAREGQFDNFSTAVVDEKGNVLSDDVNIDNVPFDPTRNKDFDLADVSDVNSYLAEKALSENENENSNNDNVSESSDSEDSNKTSEEKSMENNAAEA